MSARNRKPQVGDHVTSKRSERPYSSSAYTWRAGGSPMFEPGAMTGEVVQLDVPCVRALLCACGKRHLTFALVDFQWPRNSTWMPGLWDRVALMPCNIVRS